MQRKETKPEAQGGVFSSLYNVLHTSASYVASGISDYVIYPALYKLASLLPTPPNATPQVIIKHRKVSRYQTNKTASIAMPDLSERKVNCPKSIKKISCSPEKNTKEIKGTTASSTTTLYDMLMTYLPHTSTVTEEIKPSPKCTTEVKTEKNIKLSGSTINNEATDIIDKLKDEISEHAARRVDLFFYLLIAVHGKKVKISKADTIKQHGKGCRKKATQACHSSLFPNLKFSDENKSTMSLQGTHFDESLNMTVELPEIVNVFDGYLEGNNKNGRYIQACLVVINKVSMNEISIKEGMNEFLRIMHDFFNEFETEKLIKMNTENALLLSRVSAYEKMGTFLCTNEDKKTISNDYIFALLRLRHDDIKKVENNSDLLTAYYEQFQKETLESKASHKRQRRTTKH